LRRRNDNQVETRDGNSQGTRHTMKQLAEFIPIALFFITYQLDGEAVALGSWRYQFDGIYSATAVLMVATLLQVAVTYALSRELEKRAVWTLVAVLVFGGATLLLRNELFIQWKPTIFNWALAIAFGASQFIGEKNLMERTLGSQIRLPQGVWFRLNLLWVSNFTLVGALNLVVAYGFSESTWVRYKLYSAIGFTLLLTVLTALMISPHLKEESN
jgi:intracellular septation protein